METLELKCHNHNDYPLLYKKAEQLAISLGRFLEYRKCNISCNTCTGTCALPNMFALTLGHHACVHIRQCTRAYVTAITCTGISLFCFYFHLFFLAILSFLPIIYMLKILLKVKLWLVTLRNSHIIHIIYLYCIYMYIVDSCIIARLIMS